MGEKFIIKQSKNGLVQIKLEKYMEITAEDVVKAATSMGVDFKVINQNELVEGAINEAKEHPKVVTDIGKAVQVAYDHLKEVPDYYTKMKQIESAEKILKGGPGSGRKPEGKSKEDIPGAKSFGINFGPKTYKNPSDVVSTKAPDPHSPGRIHSDIQDFINDGGSAFDAINIASSKHGISYEEAGKIFRQFGGRVTGENV